MPTSSPAFDPFELPAPAQRRAQLEAYLEFLQDRDGEVDTARRVLSKRERAFVAMDSAPVRSAKKLDREAFLRFLHQTPPTDTAPELLWLLIAAKANQGERYGVELALERVTEDDGSHGRFIALEEVYHTRILMDACKVFGLEFEMSPPKAGVRGFIHLLEAAPEKLRMPMVHCGEIVGVAVFELLWEKLELFASEPEVYKRLKELLGGILVDELGHVAFCRASMGRVGMSVARMMQPVVARSILADIPELTMLAGGRAAFLERIGQFRSFDDPQVAASGFAPDNAV